MQNRNKNEKGVTEKNNANAIGAETIRKQMLTTKLGSREVNKAKHEKTKKKERETTETKADNQKSTERGAT
jgi:hypothetical protein